MTLGQRIGQYRRKLSISQEELGGRLGVSRQAVSKWETDAATPDMENLLALARIFGVSVAELTATPESSAPEAEKTAEQKEPDQTEKQQKVTAQKEQPEQEQEPDAPKKSILERFFGRIEYLPEKLLNLASRLLQTAFRLLELPFRLLEKLEQKIQAGRRLKRKWESVKKFFRSKMFREALLHAKKEVLYFLKKAAPKKVTGTVRFGFDDPALTGETLGILGMIYGKLPKDLSIQPDFEQEILQGDVRMKGSFQAVTAAGIALRLFRDQNLRKTIRHFKHKEA